MIIRKFFTYKWSVWMFFVLGALSILLAAGNGCSQAGATPTSPATAAVTKSTESTPNAAQTGATTSSVPSISVQDASALIQKDRANPDFVIIDVRTAGEFSGGHLAGAVNFDFYSPDFKAQVDKLDRNKEYLIYCQTGIRGRSATQIMIDLGFTKVHNLSGGIVEWTDAGNPTTK